jgi:regulator of protease activity HflC (stomatin/prohibitin superfamily)
MATGDFESPLGPEQSAQSRHASVTLRSRAQADDPATQLDPANQSLAEALGLVFRLLQFAMVVLFGVFLFSGFQSIKETESGIRLLFGKPTGENLPPGFQFAFPYPLGEMIKVDTGAVRLNVDQAFWPRLTDEQRRMTIQQLAGQGMFRLKPGEDGSLITGDQNLVHTQWRAMYQRRDPVQFVRNISPEAERDIVRAAIQRGVVQSVSQVTIDGLLRQTTEQGSVATRAREIAQATLDRIGAGIEIDLLTLEEQVPPLFVYNDFAGVQSAEQRALKARIEAETQARSVLNAVAGGAHEHLTNQIDLYEQAIALGDREEQERILTIVRALMDGREVEIEGEQVRSLVAGEVTAMLNEARQYRSSIVSQRKGDLARFQAILTQFRSNPDVVLQSQWADAMKMFLDHDYVEIYNLPPGVEVAELWINRDLDDARRADRLRKERQGKEAEERRIRDMERDQFRTRTDLQTVTDM